MLYHRPELFAGEVNSQADLMLAGHPDIYKIDLFVEVNDGGQAVFLAGESGSGL